MDARERHESDEQWIEGLKSSRSDAASALHDFLRRVIAAAMRRSGSVQDTDLEDYTQAACLAVLSSLDRFRGDSRFTTWATTIAIRVTWTALRRGRWPEAKAAAVLEDAESVEVTPAIERNELYSSLHEAIHRRLTDKQRLVILSELRGVPQIRLAEQLGVRANSIYKISHDARKRLRVELEARGFDAAAVRQLTDSASRKR